MFDHGSVFISASNPSIETAPGIVRFKSKDKKVKLAGILKDNASATDVITGDPVTLNLRDPDSPIVDLFGELVLDS